ncbi:hypothetical protein GGR57DRAFT_487515 [Xylariaceae sp. FL1272]|nr:hypothetical protein GGR57DRAFT_487515 [Xylariaceae sp. FL1272]
MSAAGLVSVVQDMVSSDRLPSTRRQMTTDGMQAIFAWARLVALRDQDFMRMEQLAELETAVTADIEFGCYVRFDIYVTCGLRPTS